MSTETQENDLFSTNGLVKWAKITRLVINSSPNHRQNSCKFRFYKDRQKSLCIRFCPGPFVNHLCFSCLRKIQWNRPTKRRNTTFSSAYFLMCVIIAVCSTVFRLDSIFVDFIVQGRKTRPKTYDKLTSMYISVFIKSAQTSTDKMTSFFLQFHW